MVLPEDTFRAQNCVPSRILSFALQKTEVSPSAVPFKHSGIIDLLSKRRFS